MSEPFQTALANIRETLLMMASITDRNLSMAIKALIERDDELADTVEMEDSQVDQLEVTVDEMVITYMATHAPVATDCRFMLVASKISSDLERIADQATTIARRARDLNKEPLFEAHGRDSTHGAGCSGNAPSIHHGVCGGKDRARGASHPPGQGTR